MLTVADRGCWVWPFFASSRKSPVELACESGRTVGSRSIVTGLLGVGVATSSSGVYGAGVAGDFIGLLPSDSEWIRRDDFFDPPRSSVDWPGVEVPSDRELLLARGDGGIIVTFGLMDRSLSRSDAGALLTEIDGLCDELTREMEMVGFRDVGDGEGDLCPSRCVLVLTSFAKKFGAMGAGT